MQAEGFMAKTADDKLQNQNLSFKLHACTRTIRNPSIWWQSFQQVSHTFQLKLLQQCIDFVMVKTINLEFFHEPFRPQLKIHMNKPLPNERFMNYFTSSIGHSNILSNNYMSLPLIRKGSKIQFWLNLPLLSSQKIEQAKQLSASSAFNEPASLAQKKHNQAIVITLETRQFVQ